MLPFRPSPEVRVLTPTARRARATKVFALFAVSHGLAVVVALVLAVMAVALIVAHYPDAGSVLGLLGLGISGLMLFGLARLFKPVNVPDGIPVTTADAPGLWLTVNQIAAYLKIPPPDEIRLGDRAFAWVLQEQKLFGRSSQPQCLYIGAPLLAALPVSRMLFVIAREMAHDRYSQSPSAHMVERGNIALHALQVRLSNRNPLRWLFNIYWLPYLWIHNAISRHNELEADQIAGWIAGRSAAQSAVHELPLISQAWEFYLRHYVWPGADYGLAPKGVFEFFPALLSARRVELTEDAEAARLAATSRWATFPSTAQRILALHAVPDGEPNKQDGPATALFADFNAYAELLEIELLGLALLERLDWRHYSQELEVRPHRDTAWAAIAAIGRVCGTQSHPLLLVLDEIEAGRGPALAAALSRAGMPDRGLEALVWLLAFDCGAARAEHYWDGPTEIFDRNGNPFSAAELLAELDVTPESARRVRAKLTAAGIECEPTQSDTQSDPV